MARSAGNTRTAPARAAPPPHPPQERSRCLSDAAIICTAEKRRFGRGRPPLAEQTKPLHSSDIPDSRRCTARFDGNTHAAPKPARGLHLRRIPRRSGADACTTQRLSAQRRSGASDAEDRRSRSKQSRFIHPAFQMISPAQNRLCNRARRRVRRVRTGSPSVGKPWAFRFSPAAFRSMKLLFRHAKMPAALLGWHFCLRKRTRRAPFSQERSALREASVIPR